MPQFSNWMPSLKVPPTCASSLRSSIPSSWLKPTKGGIVASPTPTVPIASDSMRIISKAHPAVPPNTASLAPRRRLLALGTASALAIVAASPALAQDAPAHDKDKDTADATADPEPGDQIIVTCYRASLRAAQSINRNADTFVDVISAEDIGALPDRSVAEALQRVPGVNIGRFEKPSDPDRFSVEGTGVIICGLNFVRSELNGRDIFSANGGTVLNFNEVSPELLGRVEVFKNLTADAVEGARDAVLDRGFLGRC